MSVVEDHDMGGNSISFLEADGFRYPIVDPEIVKGMTQLKVKDDDIFLLAYPKSGTHWLWETTSMLLQGKAETIPHWKSKVMVEFQPQEVIDAFPGSPRVLNTHVRYNQLPAEAREKKCRIIFVLRNPKDVVVSSFNHHKGFKNHYGNYNGSFKDYLPFYLAGKINQHHYLLVADYGSWFDYVLQWEKDIEAQQDRHPIHIMYYEDMKQNPLEEIRKLAVFLGVHADDSLYSAVAEKCSFKNMKDDKKPYDPKFNGQLIVYRKGQVGDWQNWLTPEQNEMFDKLYQEKMKDSKFKDKMRFTLA
ncbi:sulfotransferase 1B1-like [Haliotis rubra]|uniref:sulfotransferase 1B1-like n=1 Tax=Haliotis rubra TaxID=36100 RepID=UPI001EE5B51E|nr:sulfotransferase 1B1-like [Haliotis rubra]